MKYKKKSYKYFIFFNVSGFLYNIFLLYNSFFKNAFILNLLNIFIKFYYIYRIM